MFRLDRRILTHFDYMQPILFLPIILISFFLIFEANPFLAEKQFVYACVGLFAFMVFFFFPIRKFIWIIPVAYWINIFLLLSVDIFGVEKLGAKRWL
ncbi:FtsW/RodA/SpoVE family cell cycle protein, partial [Campylobacter jejuni]